MLNYTTTQTIKTNQNILSLYATLHGRSVKIEDIRQVYDTNPAETYLIADVRERPDQMPFSCLLSELSNIYAIVTQEIKTC